MPTIHPFLGKFIHPRIKKFAWNKFRPYFCHGNVAMLHTGRCGSTVLADLIGQHPHVLSAGEIYMPLRPWMGGVPDGFEPFEYLRRSMVAAQRRWYLFEVQINYTQLDEVLHTDVSTLIRELQACGVNKFIVLERRNALRSIISGVIAQRRKQWHCKKGAPQPPQHIHINHDQPYTGKGNEYSLIELLDEIAANYKSALSLLPAAETLHLSYEDHIQNNPLEGYREVASFLNLAEFSPSVSFQKVNPQPMKEICENLAELENVLANTPYQWMAQDDEAVPQTS